MGSFTFVHCADLHLGSRFKGLGSENSELAESMRQSVMGSFSRIVDLAIRERADALVISGDVFDDSNELPSTRMWFSRQLSRLDVPVFICKGNHDARTSWDDSIPYPKNVHEFGTDVEGFEIGSEVEVIGVSFSTPHEERNLAAMIKGDPDRFTIACLHCDVASVSEGYPYAPCQKSDMIGRSVDYWALGHIHKRNVVSTDPYIVYPGNIQGRNFRETGEKGAYLVRVNDKVVTEFRFVPTQGYKWADMNIDIEGKDLEDVVRSVSVSADRNTVCRITLTGHGRLDTMLRTKKDDVAKAIASGSGCIISDLIVATSPEIDLESRSKSKDVAAAVIRYGMDMGSLSKDEIIDIICHNKVMSRHRAILESMSEQDVRSLVSDAIKDCIVKMEVSR